MMLSLYRSATFLLAPMISLYLKRRMARGKEDPIRFSERLGVAGKERADGPLIWLHGASVGESLSMLPLIDRLQKDHPSAAILVTTGTLTSAKLMAERLPQGALHQYIPVDRAPYVRRFLDHWKPDMVLWFEADFWPNMICEIARRKMPLVLINGRISAESFEGWQKAKGMIAQLLRRFSLCFGQAEEDCRRLETLGASNTACVGNLKFASAPLPADPEELLRLEQAFNGRPRWVAASTHEGEETLIAAVHTNAKKKHPGLLTLIAPRHPERGDAIAAQLRAQGLEVAQRSKNERLGMSTDVYLTDTLGEMGLWFTLCPIVFIGKSLVHHGGQNPLEPAKMDCAILHGPGMRNFEYIAGRLRDSSASLEVADHNRLTETLLKLLDDPDTVSRLAKAAKAIAEAEAGVVDRLMERLDPVFPESLQRDGS